MLNSWFKSKDHEKANESTDHSNLHRIITDTNEGADESLPANTTPPTGFTSPHDAVLAQMCGQPHVEYSNDGLLRKEVLGRTGESYPVPDGADCTGINARKEVIHEPFDGTPIGLLTNPLFDASRQSTTTTTTDACKEEQWQHLSQVLNLQNELAKMHLEMEGVGMTDGKGKGRPRGKGTGKGDTNSWENRNRGGDWKPNREVTTNTISADGNDGDEEGVDAAGNEENEVKKAREEEFANMAEQFEGRKESIQGIMSKLDQLSKALTEFHVLQAPTFEFSKGNSRQNSTTPDATPPPAQSKITPYMSTSLPNAGLLVSDTHRLRPVLPTVPSSRGSTPQAEVESKTASTSVLPASLSREPLIVNVMEPGKQTHVIDSPDSMVVSLPPE